MLEAKMEEVGVKGKFDTTAFSFNAVHQTLYTVNFSTMKQLNTESGKVRGGSGLQVWRKFYRLSDL